MRTASWPAALDLVAERMLKAKEDHGTLSILHYWDSGSKGFTKGLYGRLGALLGGFTEPRGSLCWSAGLAAQRADFGRVLGNAAEDLARTRAVVIWGRNPADTSPHSMTFLGEIRDRGGPVVVIDPRRTATVTELGAKHLAPRPGTDAILALAVAAELIRRETFDRRFCERRAGGFEAFARSVNGLTAARAATECGIPLTDVLALADLVAFRGTAAQPVAFLIGYGLQRHAHGGETVRAIDALAALAGSIGRPGGGANYANLHLAGLVRDLSCVDAVAQKRYFDRPAFGRQVAALLAPDADTGAAISVFLCHGANPVTQLPNTHQVVDTLRRIPFKVVAELRQTDTTALADVVLPVADSFEDEDLYFHAWHHYVTWGLPAVAPPGDVWPEVRLVSELARRLGLGRHFGRTSEEWIAYGLEPLLREHPSLAPGGDVRQLRGCTFANPAAADVPWRDGRFATTSGLFEFGSRWSSTRSEGLTVDAHTGFHLITPQHRYTLHSQFYEEVLKRVSPRSRLPTLFVNPRTAERLGLTEGRRVRVTAAGGHLCACLALDDGLREDTVCLYSGGAAGLVVPEAPATANVLTPDDITDIGYQAALYDCVCSIEPCPEVTADLREV